MKIVIPGGSGQVGGVLARHFAAGGHEVVLLSRRPSPSAGTVRTTVWDGETLGPWTQEFDRADVVVNLAGRSVNCRYGATNRRRILQSRLKSTEVVGRAILQSARPPAVWLQASTATIYAHRYDAPNGEATGRLGGNEPDMPETWRFSIQVAREWETAATAFDLPHTRRVLLRSAIILSPDAGGVFEVLLRLVRLRLGGTVGDGRQFVSWIHDRDFVRAVDWLIAREDVAGPVNLAAPHPLPNAEFMRTLRRAWGVRFGLPAPKPVLEIGTFLLRTESELVLKSRRVAPGRLLDAGFEFEYPRWPDAAADLCDRVRRGER